MSWFCLKDRRRRDLNPDGGSAAGARLSHGTFRPTISSPPAQSCGLTTSTSPDVAPTSRSILDPSRPTDLQLSSSFFTRLPTDVRILIYESIAVGWPMPREHSLADGAFLEAAAESGFVGIAIRGDANRDGKVIGPVRFRHECHLILRGHPGCMQQRESGLGTLLTLAMSCRRLYAEALDVLYAASPFVFHTLPRLHAWMGSLIPENRARIKALNVYFFTTEITESQYEEFTLLAREIAGLDGLRRVEVFISKLIASKSLAAKTDVVAELLEPGCREGLQFTLVASGERRLLRPSAVKGAISEQEVDGDPVVTTP